MRRPATRLARARRRFRSVRARAAVAAALAATVVFTAGALWMRHTVHTERMSAAVEAARNDALSLAEAYVREGDGHPFDARSSNVCWAMVRGTGHLFAYNGQNLLEPYVEPGSRSWFPSRLPLNEGLPTTVRLRVPSVPEWKSSLDGRRVTFAAMYVGENPRELRHTREFEGSRPEDYTVVYVLASPADADAAVASVDRGLYVGVPAAVLFVAAIAWSVTGRALGPVEAIRRELATITATRLDRRVPVPPSGDQIAQLARTTNATLDRLEDAVSRQRRFVADAAHELRSPLAGLRNRLEVGLAGPQDADWPETAAGALAGATRLQHLIDDLLLLERLDRPVAPKDRLVDLTAVTDEQVAERRYVDPDGPRFVVEHGVEATVHGDEGQLGRLVRNLLENAARHADEEVQVRVRPEPDGHVAIEVHDDGPGIPQADRERVFDRFTRLDDARSRETGGTGLGLAIARGIATRHGGTLHVADSPSGALFTARFPTADVPGHDPTPPNGDHPGNTNPGGGPAAHRCRCGCTWPPAATSG